MQGAVAGQWRHMDQCSPGQAQQDYYVVRALTCTHMQPPSSHRDAYGRALKCQTSSVQLLRC